jgi:hypothetical protein
MPLCKSWVLTLGRCRTVFASANVLESATAAANAIVVSFMFSPSLSTQQQMELPFDHSTGSLAENPEESRDIGQQTPAVAIRRDHGPDQLVEHGRLRHWDLRVKSNLSSRIKPIWPVRPQLKKYFLFSELFTCGLTQITSIFPKSRPTQRGVAQRQQRGTGMRWTRRRCWTHSAEADERKRVVLMPQGWRQVGG